MAIRSSKRLLPGYGIAGLLIVAVLLPAALAWGSTPPRRAPGELPLRIVEAREPESRLWLAASDRRYTDYENLSPEEKARFRKKLKAWQSLSPEERKTMKNRMNRWKDLPPEKQKTYQKRFKQLQDLSPGERQKLRRQLDEWDELSPREKKRIKNRFKNKD